MKQCGFSSCSVFYDRYVRRADRICSGTIELPLLNMFWMKNDEGVSDDAEHSRHARQAIGARRRPVFLTITSKFHLRRHFFTHVRFCTPC